MFVYLTAPSLRRQWHPTPVLLPGKSHGQRGLVGCSSWGREESDTTEQLHVHFHALEKEMATHSNVLAWRIPGMGSHRVGHDWSDLAVAVVLVTAHEIVYLSFGMQTLSWGLWDLVPWPGIKPRPLALGARSPCHWTTRVNCVRKRINFSVCKLYLYKLI